jgi:hypothetical protein
MSVSGKLIVIFGASGDCGKASVQALLDAGASVRAYCRNPDKLGITHEKLEVSKGDLTDVAATQAAIAGADGVLCLVGGPQTKDFKGGLLMPVLKTIHEGMLLHKVKRIVVQLGAMCIAPKTMMPNEKWTMVKNILLPYVAGPSSVFHGCHVDNDAAMSYFATLTAEENEQLHWTLTRPTALSRSEGGFAEDPSHGVLVSGEHIYLPSENGAAFVDFGTYYTDMFTKYYETMPSDEKAYASVWVHKAPFTRYERADKSDIPSGGCIVM